MNHKKTGTTTLQILKGAMIFLCSTASIWNPDLCSFLFHGKKV